MATIAHSKDDLSPDSLMALIRRVRGFCELKEADIRNRTGLTEAQYSFLRVMPIGGPLRTGELCRLGGLSPSRGGRVIDEMVREGFLSRVEDPEDRRIQTLNLAQKGLAARRQILALITRCDEILWERLSAPDLEKVLGGLKALASVIEER